MNITTSDAKSGPNDQPLQSQETDSLVKRLAGPSSGKAGLALDQTEINRIITEASKGSKFYENEKKKDKELTERISTILKQRDEATQGVDIEKTERSADQMLAHLEAQRDLTQIIVHVDMDAFYASVELLDNPSLAGKAFAVGKGVLTTASYEARKYGVRSGMASFIAKKLCPELILTQNRFSRYSEMSNKVMDIFHRYDPNMCPAGCDEGYLNITAYCEEHLLTAAECVQEMRDTVFGETKLTVSAGIAPNKMLAKICSDKNKPNGQFQLEFDSASIRNFMRDLSIRKVPGIGRVNERLLEAIGIKTCGDIYTQRAVVLLMDKYFGCTFLFRTHLGIASNVVQPHSREERKSIGAERTFSSLSGKEKILDKLQEVAEELEQDMEQRGWTGRTITLKYKLDTYKVFTRAKSCSRWVSTKEELFAIGKELLLPELPLTLRLIGLRVTKLKDTRKEDSNAGIKRFFEAAKDQSPRKRARVSTEGGDEQEREGDSGHMDEVMPGLYGHDEGDDNIDLHDEHEVIDLSAHDEERQQEPESRPEPGPSKSGVSPSTSRSTGSPKGKSHARAPTSPPKVKAQTLECPICSRTLETDNQGLNTHIDFCLSRGAIMEAQTETNKLGKESKKFTGWPKPKSAKGKADSKGKAPVSKPASSSKSKG